MGARAYDVPPLQPCSRRVYLLRQRLVDVLASEFPVKQGSAKDSHEKYPGNRACIPDLELFEGVCVDVVRVRRSRARGAAVHRHDLGFARSRPAVHRSRS